MSVDSNLLHKYYVWVGELTLAYGILLGFEHKVNVS